MTSRPTETTTPRHVHRRDHRPCPATLHEPLEPTKPASIWLFQFADAILHETTYTEFVARWPGQFGRLVEVAS